MVLMRPANRLVADYGAMAKQGRWSREQQGDPTRRTRRPCDPIYACDRRCFVPVLLPIRAPHAPACAIRCLAPVPRLSSRAELQIYARHWPYAAETLLRVPSPARASCQTCEYGMECAFWQKRSSRQIEHSSWASHFWLKAGKPTGFCRQFDSVRPGIIRVYPWSEFPICQNATLPCPLTRNVSMTMRHGAQSRKHGT